MQLVNIDTLKLPLLELLAYYAYKNLVWEILHKETHHPCLCFKDLARFAVITFRTVSKLGDDFILIICDIYPNCLM